MLLWSSRVQAHTRLPLMWSKFDLMTRRHMDAIELDPQLMVDSFSEASTSFGLTFHLGKTEVLL